MKSLNSGIAQAVNLPHLLLLEPRLEVELRVVIITPNHLKLNLLTLLV